MWWQFEIDKNFCAAQRALSKIICSCRRIGLFPFAGEFQLNGSKAEKDTSSTNTSDTHTHTRCDEFSMFARFCCTFRFVSLSVLPRSTSCSINRPEKSKIFIVISLWKGSYILIAREKTLLWWTKKILALYSCLLHDLILMSQILELNFTLSLIEE